MDEELKKLSQIKKAQLHRKEWLEHGEQMLRSHMSTHPVQTVTNTVPVRPNWKETANFYFMKAKIVGLVVVLLFGGVSTAAASALPGDTLYGWKLGVNERVVGGFKLSDESKAEYAVELVDKRLSEIEELATSDDASARTEALQSFDDQYEDALEHLAKLDDDSDLREALEEHATSKVELEYEIESEFGSSLDDDDDDVEPTESSRPTKSPSASQSPQPTRIKIDDGGLYPPSSSPTPSQKIDDGGLYPPTPKIVNLFACSDYCPGDESKYIIKVYEGVKDKYWCDHLDGRFGSFTGWGTTYYCAVQ